MSSPLNAMGRVARTDAPKVHCDQLEASLAITFATCCSADSLLAEAIPPADARELEAVE
jgi:hypothetical protein